MKLSELAEKTGAKIVVNNEKAREVEVARVYAGDNISDILNQVSGTTLLVTNLSNSLLPRVADLMDGHGILLVNGVVPKAELLDAAQEHETVILVSPVGMFETCGRLYQCLNGKAEAMA
jgi:hypothetical protein